MILVTIAVRNRKHLESVERKLIQMGYRKWHLNGLANDSTSYVVVYDDMDYQFTNHLPFNPSKVVNTFKEATKYL